MLEMEVNKMKTITLPEDLGEKATNISIEELKLNLKQAENRPSIKEQLILKMYEIADKTKKLYDTDEITVLKGIDHTGIYLCCINKTNTEITLVAPLVNLGLDGKCSGYCVLNGEDIKVASEKVELKISALDAVLAKLTEVE